MTMTSFKYSLRMQPYRQWVFVLYFVLITIIDFSYTVDGLSTTNDRGMYGEKHSSGHLYFERENQRTQMKLNENEWN